MAEAAIPDQADVRIDASNRVETRPDESVIVCDRCGASMVQRDCKVICRNCGHRFDCSDLNIYWD